MDRTIQTILGKQIVPSGENNRWGPNGFTNTIHKIDIKPEGEWHLTMHSPNGVECEIKSVFREIVKHKKIVYEQLNHFNTSPLLNL